LATLSVLIPFVLWRHSWFEWANYYWLVLQQQKAVRSGFFPTYFLQTPSTGYFYPIFAFNGAPASWLAAVVGTGLGSGWAGFVAMLALASSASYLGTWWIARIGGLSRAWAVLPALVVSMSSYTADDLYGRGDWAEMLVIGFVPLLAAGLISLVRNPVAPVWRMVCVVVSAVVVLGSDNAEVIALFVFGLVTAVCFLPMIRHTREFRRGMLVASLAALIGGCLDAWYLAPSLAYGRSTMLYQSAPGFISAGYSSNIDRFTVLLDPARSIILRYNFHPQLPALALLWSLAAGVYWWRRPELRRVGIALCVAIACGITLLSSDAIWVYLPSLIRAVQFPFRMIPFVVLATAGLVIVGLRAVDGRVFWRAGAVLACGAIAGLTLYQAWTATNIGWNGHAMTVSANATPYPFTFPGQQNGFHFLGSPTLADPKQRIAVRAAADDSYGATAHPGPAVADVAWSPLIRARGGTIVGVDGSGFAVTRVTRPKVSFTSQVTPPVLAGLILTFGAVVEVPVALVACRRRPRPRKAA
jgi:hypothetical protein